MFGFPDALSGLICRCLELTKRLLDGFQLSLLVIDLLLYFFFLLLLLAFDLFEQRLNLMSISLYVWLISVLFLALHQLRVGKYDIGLL